MPKKTIVDINFIDQWRPCESRRSNYVKHYGKRKFTVKQFLALKHITHNDKLWVAFRALPRYKMVRIAAEIAQSVLPIYERQYPGDTRSRNCVESLLKHGRVSQSVRNAAYAAYAAADANAAAYAAYAAYAAANAANANAANAYANAAAYANAYAAADAARYAAAAYAERASNGARLTQEAVNLKIVAKYWK